MHSKELGTTFARFSFLWLERVESRKKRKGREYSTLPVTVKSMVMLHEKMFDVDLK